MQKVLVQEEWCVEEEELFLKVEGVLDQDVYVRHIKFGQRSVCRSGA